MESLGIQNKILVLIEDMDKNLQHRQHALDEGSGNLMSNCGWS